MVASNRSFPDRRPVAAPPLLTMAEQQQAPPARRRAGLWPPEVAARRQLVVSAAAARVSQRAPWRFRPAAAVRQVARAKPPAVRPSATSASSASAAPRPAHRLAEARSSQAPSAAAGRCGRRAYEPPLMAPESPPRLDTGPAGLVVAAHRGRCQFREPPSPPWRHRAARCRRPAATRHRARPPRAVEMTRALTDRYSTADLPGPGAVQPPTTTSAPRPSPPKHQANLCVSFVTAPTPRGRIERKHILGDVALKCGLVRAPTSAAPHGSTGRLRPRPATDHVPLSQERANRAPKGRSATSRRLTAGQLPELPREH